MSSSLSRLLIAISTAVLIAISFVMIILTSPSMLVGFESADTIELVVERATSDAGDVLSVIDLNAASAEDLMALPDLGETLAQRIVAYRNEHGRFQYIEELKNVEGIGDTRLIRWTPYLTVG